MKHSFRRTVAGSAFTAEAMVDACASCLEPNVPAALIVAFERALAAELARRGPISGETFRWIRKAAGLERSDLTKLLGISMESIAAWEEERRPIDFAAWTMVATLVLDAHEGPRALRTRLNARLRRTESAATPLALARANARTLAKVLELLSGPIAFTDADIADALDVDCRALRASLRNLALLGLLHSSPTNGEHDESLRWDPVSRDRTGLFRAATTAGIDLDTPLPPAKLEDGSAPHSRVASVTWRAAT